MLTSKHLLVAARDAIARRDWGFASEGFLEARSRGPLSGNDLDAFSRALWWLGRVDEALDLTHSAYLAHVEVGNHAGAAGSAIRMSVLRFLLGDTVAAVGWLQRAQRLLTAQPPGELHGIAQWAQSVVLTRQGDYADALELTRELDQLGTRLGFEDLVALAQVVQGRALVLSGRVGDGVPLLEQAAQAAASDRLAPEWTGAIHYFLMQTGHDLGDVRLTVLWTDAAARWCADLPELSLFPGLCSLHRARVLTLQGLWDQAEREARRASLTLAHIDVAASAEADYRVGELARLRGDVDQAENCYAQAQRLGRLPLPGLAQLRLGQGRATEAAEALERALDGPAPGPAGPSRLARAELLGARVEAALDGGDPARARTAYEELSGIAADFGSSGLTATARRAGGAVLLAEGSPADALPKLRSATRLWQELDAPYEAARTRLLLIEAFRTLGHDDAASLEVAAAAEVFERLRADLDLTRLAALRGITSTPRDLSGREEDVLRLVAAGRSDQEVAERLFVSEQTVVRHLGAIYGKLGVSDRRAAATFAAEHGLLRKRQT